MSDDVLFHGILESIALMVGFGVLFDMYLRWKDRKEEMIIREKEMDFRNKYWAMTEEGLKRQITGFRQILPDIAKELKHELVDDTGWLRDGLRKTEMFPFEETIFGKKSAYFEQEKKFISQMITPQIIRYIESLPEDIDRICLILDSGTTMLPFFSDIAKATITARVHDPRPDWTDKLEIITNNFPGMLRLIDASRDFSQRGNSTSDLSDSILKCSIVAGQLSVKYAAITGPAAQKSIVDVLDRWKQEWTKCHIISLVTGTWIRLNGGAPLPLARGVGQLDFKQVIMHFSDKSFVIAPLGKVFGRAALEDINKLLREDVQNGVGSGAKYESVMTDHPGCPIDPKKIRLVTTVRTNPRSILRAHSASIALQLGVPPEPSFDLVSSAQESGPVFFSFDPKSDSLEEQMRIEFPDPDTRNNPEFLKAFEV